LHIEDGEGEEHHGDHHKREIKHAKEILIPGTVTTGRLPRGSLEEEL
jgi:hypothetical protein